MPHWPENMPAKPNTLIAVFARPAVPGRAKTRLIAAVGEDGAARLAAAFFADTWETVARLGWARAVLATTEPLEGAWLQGDGDLGARVERIVTRALAEAPWTIALGADSPGMPVDRLEAARGAMERADAAIVPAADGGFVLLAMILVAFLASNPDVQKHLRAEPDRIGAACDEILRMRAPLIANRRRTTREVTVADRRIPAGERIMVLWASANRDEAVFGDPDEFRLDRDPAANLLYGRGIHNCPGAPLARLELTALVDELLAATTNITATGAVPEHAAYPAGGFTRVPVVLTRH